METELEKVNWVLVKHYVWQAKIVMAAMQAAHSEEARCSFLRTATNYMEHCMQQLEHVMTGRSLTKEKGYGDDKQEGRARQNASHA